jgi:hypothetical protein
MNGKGRLPYLAGACFAAAFASLDICAQPLRIEAAPAINYSLCSSWASLASEAKERPLDIQPFTPDQVTGDVLPGRFVDGKKEIRGLFRSKGQPYGFVVNAPDPGFLFVTPRNFPFEFYATGKTSAEKKPKLALSGILEERPAGVASTTIHCRNGDATRAMVQSFPDEPVLRHGAPPAGESPLSSAWIKDVIPGAIGPGEKIEGRPLPALGRSETLTSVFEPTPTPKESINSLLVPKSTTPSSTKPPAERKDKVCQLGGAWAELTMTNEVRPSRLQTAGLRNSQTDVKAFDFLAAPGEAIPLDATADVRNTIGKVVPFETIAARPRAIGSLPQEKRDVVLWVAAPSAGDLRDKKVDSASKTKRTLNIVMIGGAAEVAMSGLSGVQTEFDRITFGNTKLDIEWFSVTSAGDLEGAGRYRAFPQLVEAATEKAGSNTPDVLDDNQVATLLDNIQQRLLSRTTPADRVIWVKGAYSLGSGMPLRFEKMINAIGNSNAVPHRADGAAGNWLVVITARMRGFSIGYLKEPVYRLSIGDVIEEADPSARGVRRFLSVAEANALATRLSAAPPLPGSPSASANSDRVSAVEKLVFDAGELFKATGYLMSAVGAKSLSATLESVIELWGADKQILTEPLRRLAASTGKTSPSFVDLLQNAGNGWSPLPKTLPDWARKPLNDLNPTEASEAFDWVDGLVSHARTISAAIDSAPPSCTLVFVPDTQFGFGRQ